MARVVKWYLAIVLEKHSCVLLALNYKVSEMLIMSKPDVLLLSIMNHSNNNFRIVLDINVTLFRKPIKQNGEIALNKNGPK